jgi:hypothetical protein
LELDLALNHVHPLFPQLVHRFEHNILTLADGEGSSVDIADKVIECDEGSRSADTCATCETATVKSCGLAITN